jgi:hypothetical protein
MNKTAANGSIELNHKYREPWLATLGARRALGAVVKIPKLSESVEESGFGEMLQLASLGNPEQVNDTGAVFD